MIPMKALRILLPTLIGLALSACHSKNSATDASGTFEATEVMISAQANGIIEAFTVEEGYNVPAGVVLGYIDTVQLALKKKQLQASLRAIKAKLPDVGIQIAALEQQLATAGKEQKRLENLVRSNAAPQKQLDDVNAQLEVLQKQLNASRSSLENGNASASDEMDALKAQLEQVEDLLAKSYIQSPIGGTVLVKYAEQGELAAPGKVLFKVADMNRMKLRVYVTADQLAKLKVGQQVRVNAEFGTTENKAYRGTVTWISDKSEFTPKTIQTRDERANLVYAVFVSVPNDGNLKIGMYGGIYLEETKR